MKFFICMFVFFTFSFANITDMFIKECENGNAKICTDLGHSYEYGRLVRMLPSDYYENFTKLKCEQNSAIDCIAYADLYEKTDKANIRKKALNIFINECDNGDINACDNAAKLYYHHEFLFNKKLENSEKIGLEFYMKEKSLYEKECEKDDAYSCMKVYELCNLILKTDGQIYLSKAHQIYEKECESGNTKSCIERLKHEEDNEITTKIFGILKDSCNNGDLDSCDLQQYEISSYFTKTISENDKNEIIKNYLNLAFNACENKNALACLRLGKAYINGEFLTKDIEKAKDFFIKSMTLYAKECENENRDSCKTFDLYYNNRASIPVFDFEIPIKKDENLSRKYFLKGCEINNSAYCNE